MIKTQTKEECVLLRDIMPKYVAHLTSNPNSLLVRFYGMHRYDALVLQVLCTFRCQLVGLQRSSGDQRCLSHT
jgi:hypothetical protein